MGRFRRLPPLLLALTAVLAVAPAGAQAARHRPAQGLWTGTTYPDNVSTFTFHVKGHHLSRFVAKGVGCFAISGYQTMPLTFPRSTAIRSGGSFHEVRHVVGTRSVLKGRFTGRRAASGTLSNTGGCDTGTQKWVARPGHKPPVLPTPKHPSCSAASCTATDGLRLTVTGVDTTLTSLQDPNAGPYSSTVDQQRAATGGVLAVLRVTNTAKQPVSFTTSGGEWTLRDGAGGYDASRLENDLDVVTQDGRIPTDANTSRNDLVTLGPGQTDSSLTLCFAVPAAARQNLQLLFDYPSTMASLPLG